ncbi:MAG: amidohydrolase family protein [Micromonosporaceae bacterium]
MAGISAGEASRNCPAGGGHGHAAQASRRDQGSSPDIDRRGNPQVRDLYRRGVTLISGADSGIHPVKAHGTLPHAVIDLVDCGVPTTIALASATSLAAPASGLAGRTGRLRTGLDADLLLVNGDPTTDITAIHDIRTVVSRGRVVNPGLGT